MRLLVIFAHPSETSFGAALYARAVDTLSARGHELRCHDLYREGFDPVLSREQWNDYLPHPERNTAQVQDHVDDLLWAEGLVVIYPTWYYGPPAMLKGWLERVWLPGVAFGMPPTRRSRPVPKLRHIRIFVGITTSGSPWWWLRVIRDPGRSLWTRGLRVLFHPRVRVIWRQLHAMDNLADADRRAFLDRVSATLAKV